ncbi:hypothetical protein C0991_009839 [Blastosporella zonata]|nr:hypothetical protein C0991_009839 [Blastosporella zonata]
MAGKVDFELGNNNGNDDQLDYRPSTPKTSKKQFLWGFLTGIIACGVLQLTYNPGRVVARHRNHSRPSAVDEVHALAPPYVGSTEVHTYPPTHPTNANPTLFPSDVGYPGGTPTGAEPAVILTAPTYPIQTGAAQLVRPDTLGNKPSKGRHFDLFKKWGNLSPWYSVGRGAFGLDSDPTVPETSSYGGPPQLAGKLNKATTSWNATGELDFLNDWYVKMFQVLLRYSDVSL